LFLFDNVQGDEMMLLIAGIVLVISGVIGFILQIRYIQENQAENVKNS
jgi:hypothetical protein